MSAAFTGFYSALSGAPHITALWAAGKIGSGLLAGHA